MTERLCSLLVALSLLVLCAGPDAAHAQRTSGAVGLGGQLGEPSGLTLKVYNEASASYDFLAAWSFVDDFFFLNTHAQWNSSFDPDNVDQGFEWFFGPGAYVGVTEGGPDEEAVIGVSGRLGLNLVIEEQLEFYGQVTPRISVIPDTEGDVGGGVGLRFYF